MFMADMPGRVLLALVLAAPLTVGCLVRTHGQPPPGRASVGHVPPGQIRRAEVHERNDARKAERSQGNKHGHHQSRGRGKGNGN
jgi:hypothetical protein